MTTNKLNLNDILIYSVIMWNINIYQILFIFSGKKIDDSHWPFVIYVGIKLNVQKETQISELHQLLQQIHHISDTLVQKHENEKLNLD